DYYCMLYMGTGIVLF
nr:immunoglobulin light chain junction region [Macaca mulatta]MOX78014.1 immunoglobulin light chain junction region [Macaca mulatta]MOX78979.1 immunoglobulin light chain junction region [Macaca mulatta]MOX79764.1 immunoglobulin light chain junction region [Macaca mulatta]MOX80222.1 immunoglobulin light chain junction region [Macaca mulatta]